MECGRLLFLSGAGRIEGTELVKRPEGCERIRTRRELGYDVDIRDGYDISGTDLPVLQTVGSLVITTGLAVSFYEIVYY